MAVATTTFRERKKRIQNYVEGVLPYYSVDDFKDRFRISRETFDSLVEQMIPYIENYINRKGYPSLILQAVCDCNPKFLDVYCGWPGSVHDARVLRNSPLFKSASAAESEEIYMFPINTHLLGDSAYPLSNWLMVPFKDFGNLNEIQKRYNYKHSSTRVCIEIAFGALKGRFRRLKFVDLTDIKAIVHVVLSCCCLHQPGFHTG
ncbi:putative nuclease HARBI1 [Ruditapes philippinarum]|uniref:putative nuclease HARBI1 n=1 Tax=Ruditapes philippinarum TaxID=129788 RepID=UPI00295C0074|nr:putative nuclease HARBI1 [Ruditapes philippinarum]